MKTSRFLAIIGLSAGAVFFLIPALALAAEGGYDHRQWMDLLYRLLNFAVFFLILFLLLRRPVGKFFSGRREQIARTLEYLETQARNLDEQNEILRRKIDDVASERDSILAQYERMGQKEHDRLLAEAGQAAAAIVQKTRSAMEQETRLARQLLLDEIVRLSTGLATELTQSNIDAEDQKRLTRDFMAQVEKLSSAGDGRA